MASSIQDLPLVLISDIFCRLPVEDIISCRCVSKAWCNLTKETHFLNNHHCRGTQTLLLQADLETKEWNIIGNQLFLLKKRNCDSDDKWVAKKIETQGIDIQKLRVNASCNGLLLLFPLEELSPIYVYNPITHDYLELPKPCQDLRELPYQEFNVGFGFDPVKNQYKVVLEYTLYREDNDLVQSYGEILSVGESAWRELQFPQKVSSFGSQQFLNGAFHWVISFRGLDPDYALLALDIGNEKFQVIKFPPPTSGLDISKQIFQSYKTPNYCFSHAYLKLMNLGGSLALTELFSDAASITIRQSTIGAFHYTYSFNVSLEHRNMECELLGMLSDGCFLTRACKRFSSNTLQVENITYPCIAFYNPEKKQSQILDLPGIPGSSQAFSFTPSLLSPSTFRSR